MEMWFGKKEMNYEFNWNKFVGVSKLAFEHLNKESLSITHHIYPITKSTPNTHLLALLERSICVLNSSFPKSRTLE
jgi:hypothetical protein